MKSSVIRRGTRSAALAAAIAALASLPSSLRADSNTWLPLAGGSWSAAANWSDSLPTADDAVANHLTTSPITVDVTTAFSSFVSDSSDVLVQGGNLHGSLAAAASTAQVNGLLTVDSGGLSNLTLLQGTGPAAVFTPNGNNFLDTVNLAGTVSFAGTAYARLYNSNSLSGTLAMTGTGNGLQFHDGNALLTVTPTGTVRGFGNLSNYVAGGTLQNNGLLSADTAAQTLAVGVSNVTGTGTLEAKNGATLSFTAGAALNGSFAANAGAASTILLDSATLRGTLASSTGTGLSFSPNGNNAIDSAALNAIVTFDGTAYARLYNANTLAGQINLSTTGNGIQFHDGNALLTISPSGVIRGFGDTSNYVTGGTLANNGTVSADVAAQTLRLGQSNTTGNGTFEAKNGATLALTTHLTGTSVSILAATGTVLMDNGTLSGSVDTTTGTGLSFSPSGNNAIDTAAVNGTLTFNATAYARLYNSNTLNGRIDFSTTGNGIQFHNGNAKLTVTPAGVIRGFGDTYNYVTGGTLTNNGTISADVAAQTLRIGQSNTTGSGLFEAKNGGTLALTSLVNVSGATVAAVTGTVLVDNGTLSGSVASTTGTGVSFSPSGNNAIDSLSMAGTLTFASTAYARLYNTNSLSGTLAMAGIGNGLQFHDGNAHLTVTPAGSIRGFGTTYNYVAGGFLTVNGTASADTPVQTLTLGQTYMNGSGTLEAKNGGTLAIASDFTANNASINTDANPASAVLLQNGGLRGTVTSSTGTGLSLGNSGNNFLESATIAAAARLSLPQSGYARLYNANTIAGTLVMASTANGLQLHDGNASLVISPTGTARGFGSIYQYVAGGSVINNGTLAADTAGQTLAIDAAALTNSGAITVSAGATLAVSNGTNFSHLAGTIVVDGLLSYPNRSLAIPVGTLSGNGTLSLASLDLTGGTLAPGDSPGTLSIAGSYSQSPSSTLDIQLAGYAQGTTYDLLAVTGPAAVAGTLDVSLTAGFTPNLGDSFTFLTSPTLTGTFPTLTSSTPGLAYTVAYFPDHATLTLTSVPEPTSLLAACGLAFPLFRRRSRNA